MNTRQVYPSEADDETDSFGNFFTGSMHKFTRTMARDATIIITPKNYSTRVFPSMDSVIERDSNSLKKRVRGIMIVLKFFRLIQESSDETKLRSKQKQVKRNLFPLYPDNKILNLWNSFMSGVTLSSVIIYPIAISFDSSTELVTKFIYQDFLTVISALLDALFFIDLLLQFIICQIDANNNLITSWVDIFFFNLRSWFIFDLLSILPYRIMIANNTQNLDTSDFLSLLKLLRVAKYFLYTRKEIFITQKHEFTLQAPWHEQFVFDKQFLILFRVYKNMFLLVNVFGCLWAFLIQYNFRNYNSSFTSYVTSAYWAMQTVTVVGYGDISSTTASQYLLTIIWMLIGVGFYSFTIGNLAQTLKSDNNLDEELDNIEQLFDNVLTPESIQADVFNFVLYNMENNTYWTYRMIIQQLPINLRKQAIAITSSISIKSVPFFAIDVNYSTGLMTQLNINYYNQFDTIYSIGSPSSEVYFLITGEVRLTNMEGDTLLNIHEGYIFGEIEVLDEEPRQLQAVASAGSVILVCPIKCFFHSLENKPDLYFEIQQLVIRRKILIKYNTERTSKQHIKLHPTEKRRSVNSILFQKQQLENQFRSGINTLTFHQQQKQILGYIFGKQAERKYRVRALFKLAINSVLQYVRQQRVELRQDKKTRKFQDKLLVNFTKAQKDENQIKKKIDKSLIGFRSLKQIFNRENGWIVSQSKYAAEIMHETRSVKRREMQKEKTRIIISQRLNRIDLRGRVRIINSYNNTLCRVTKELQFIYDECYDLEREVNEQIYKLQSIIALMN